MSFEWGTLNHLQLGRYAEYVVNMEFTKLGCSVFSSEVDDRGIDFVVRSQRGRHFDVQVKSARQARAGQGFNYQYWKKADQKHQARPEIADDFYIALALFEKGDQPPRLYLIPSTAWQKPNPLFVDRRYGRSGLQSQPEFGLNLSQKNLERLRRYCFSKVAKRLV